MKKFEFYQDVKVATWKRQRFAIEAENEERAIELAKKACDGDVSYSVGIEVEDIEWLSHTESVVNVADNDGYPTIEVYRDNLNEVKIGDNAPKEEEERKFKAGEHVAVCDDKGNNYLAVVMYETWVNSGSNVVAVRPDKDGVPALETDVVEARFIYQQSRGEVCPKCGKPLYDEHNLDLDYSYYCFHCDENFYDSEVQ